MNRNKEVIRRVEEIYKWLDKQIKASQDAAGKCETCGKCCDFETFGHRLFVTSPEVIYFANKLKGKNIRKMAGGRCSYQSGGPSTALGTPSRKCTVYDFRFAGCRIFYCKGDSHFQSELTEAVIKKFKALCDEFKIPYRYIDLPTALKDLSAESFLGTD